MTVFNTFWKVINKYKGTIILFTVMLVAFGGINTTPSNNSLDFTNDKPDIIIIQLYFITVHKKARSSLSRRHNYNITYLINHLFFSF